MAGIYIHIPFCRQACFYCNFHFSTSLKNKDNFLLALTKEIEQKRNFFGDEKITTLYFGGGTPSVLSAEEINLLTNQLNRYFKLDDVIEFTLEANPEDLTAEYLLQLRQTRINRLSIGIQSFYDEDLEYMNRIHNAKTAIESVNRAAQAGFTNLTIDLIYGTPGLTDERWIENIKRAFSLPIQHLSCYALTIEEKTALAARIRKMKAKPVNEEQSARQFEILINEIGKMQWEQYEISNFARREEFYSVHNSNYWTGEPYLGLGPSAHSYNNKIRWFNLANNSEYIRRLMKNEEVAQSEVLSVNQQYNEYVMTGLRTKWGVELQFVAEQFGASKLEYLGYELARINPGHYTIEDGILLLTNSGKLFADNIAAALFEV